MLNSWEYSHHSAFALVFSERSLELLLFFFIETAGTKTATRSDTVCRAIVHNASFLVGCNVFDAWQVTEETEKKLNNKFLDKYFSSIVFTRDRLQLRNEECRKQFWCTSEDRIRIVLVSNLGSY